MNTFLSTNLTALPVRQRGQAMVFVSVTTLIVLLALLAMYSTGQLTTQKMKLQNTADAVAYSAALTQARDLNFSAYMNRAMIANQVAVAQVVSMTGWARNFDDTYNGKFSVIAKSMANLSSLRVLWSAPAKAYGTIGKGLKSAFNTTGPIVVKALDALIDALRVASAGYHLGMAATIPQTVADVMEANDPQASLSPAGIVGAATGVAQHLLFVTRYDPTADQDGDQRFANVLDASSDRFYKNRSPLNGVWPTPMLIDPVRLFQPGAGPLLMFNFHRGGSTMRSSNMKAYTSADSTGLFVIFCVTISIFGIPIPIPFPLPPLPSGSGAAAAGTYASNVLLSTNSGYVRHRNGDNDGGDDKARRDYGEAYRNPYTATTYFIQARKGPGANMDTRAGLRSYLDIKDNANGRTSNQANNGAEVRNYHNDRAPAFFVELERDSNSVATSSSSTFQIGGSAGALRLEDAAAGGKLRAMAKAQAYFSRSIFTRGDRKTEYGSLYSPYWQAHLLPNSILEQGGAVLAQMAGL
jgi:hypothetical protein